MTRCLSMCLRDLKCSFGTNIETGLIAAEFDPEARRETLDELTATPIWIDTRSSEPGRSRATFSGWSART